MKKNHFKKLVKEKTIAIKRMRIPNKDEIVKKKKKQYKKLSQIKKIAIKIMETKFERLKNKME